MALTAITLGGKWYHYQMPMNRSFLIVQGPTRFNAVISGVHDKSHFAIQKNPIWLLKPTREEAKSIEHVGGVPSIKLYHGRVWGQTETKVVSLDVALSFFQERSAFKAAVVAILDKVGVDAETCLFDFAQGTANVMLRYDALTRPLSTTSNTYRRAVKDAKDSEIERKAATSAGDDMDSWMDQVMNRRMAYKESAAQELVDMLVS